MPVHGNWGGCHSRLFRLYVLIVCRPGDIKSIDNDLRSICRGRRSPTTKPFLVFELSSVISPGNDHSASDVSLPGKSPGTCTWWSCAVDIHRHNPLEGVHMAEQVWLRSMTAWKKAK